MYTMAAYVCWYGFWSSYTDVTLDNATCLSTIWKSCWQKNREPRQLSNEGMACICLEAMEAIPDVRVQHFTAFPKTS